MTSDFTHAPIFSHSIQPDRGTNFVVYEHHRATLESQHMQKFVDHRLTSLVPRVPNGVHMLSDSTSLLSACTTFDILLLLIC